MDRCVKDRKHSVDLYSLLGVQSVADVVRHGRLRWQIEVVVDIGPGKGRKT